MKSKPKKIRVTLEFSSCGKYPSHPSKMGELRKNVFDLISTLKHEALESKIWGAHYAESNGSCVPKYYDEDIKISEEILKSMKIKVVK